MQACTVRYRGSAAFSFGNSVDTNEHASSEVHDSESRNHLALVNATLPYVCRTMSTRIAYFNIDKEQPPRRLQISYVGTRFILVMRLRVFVTTARSPVANDLVRSADPSARSPIAIDPVRSAEPSARNCDASEPVRSAEPSVRSPVASDSVRSLGNAALSPHATVCRPHASNVVRSAVKYDVPVRSNATGFIRSVVAPDVLIFMMRLTWYVRLKTMPLLST